jgi:hypothetical protein
MNFERLKVLATEDRYLRWRWLVILCFFYGVGCFLIYFGVVDAVFGVIGSGKWNLDPEPEFFLDLFESVALLVRPLLAACICWLIISFPMMACVGLWSHVSDLLRWLGTRFRR